MWSSYLLFYTSLFGVIVTTANAPILAIVLPSVFQSRLRRRKASNAAKLCVCFTSILNVWVRLRWLLFSATSAMPVFLPASVLIASCLALFRSVLRLMLLVCTLRKSSWFHMLLLVVIEVIVISVLVIVMMFAEVIVLELRRVYLVLFRVYTSVIKTDSGSSAITFSWIENFLPFRANFFVLDLWEAFLNCSHQIILFLT